VTAPLAYMLKLRDRVVLETSIRDAMGKFDAPFATQRGSTRPPVSTQA
jgi:hypothetical protein